MSSIRARARLGADDGKEAGVSELAAAAMAYVEEGRKVLPLNGKRPLYELAPNGVDSASDDPDVVRDWWRKQPQANIGLACGDGLMGLDVDGPEGSETLARLVAEHEPLPDTRRVRSGRDDHSGHHHFAGSGRGWNPGPGLSLRGEGSYVAAPPSVHPDSGRRYELLSPAPLAPLPGWLRKPEPPPRPSTPPQLDELTFRRLPGGRRSGPRGRARQARGPFHRAEHGARHRPVRRRLRARPPRRSRRAEPPARRGGVANAGERLQLGEAEIERSIGHGLEEGETEPYVLRERESTVSAMRAPLRPKPKKHGRGVSAVELFGPGSGAAAPVDPASKIQSQRVRWPGAGACRVGA